jgi:WhiB family redox-sensing transcriptional regulator
MTTHVNWHDTAACRDADPDLFFPVGTAGPGLRQIEEAKRICRACPAQAPCLAWALAHGVGSGVWGGATEAERRALRAGRVLPGDVISILDGAGPSTISAT